MTKEELRLEFEKETGISAQVSNKEAFLRYMYWLENKIADSQGKPEVLLFKQWLTDIGLEPVTYSYDNNSDLLTAEVLGDVEHHRFSEMFKIGNFPDVGYPFWQISISGEALVEKLKQAV